MEKLLWLILALRVLRWAWPYIAGVVGAVIFLGYAGRGIPAGWSLVLFAVFAVGIAHGIRGSSSSRRNDRHQDQRRYQHRHHYWDRYRRQ